MSHFPPQDIRTFIDNNANSPSVARQATLLGISRSSLYYKPIVDSYDTAIMTRIDEIYTKYPFYGSRRMKIELQQTHHIVICREHVQHLMRLMGLEAIYPKFKKHTSNLESQHRIYPYLLHNLTITHPNHVWGTDITYIKLAQGFCYLVALIDWYSRYVISWTLAETLDIEFCLENLKRALSTQIPDIHNSDQGSHFTSPQYTNLLSAHNTQISMDGRGRCMDNIFTERLWRTIKYENVYIKSYQNFSEAQQGLAEYVDFYNNKRHHQSLAYHTPASIYFKQ